MMTIMRMRCAILTIAYYISEIFVASVITVWSGKIERIDLHPLTAN